VNVRACQAAAILLALATVAACAKNERTSRSTTASAARANPASVDDGARVYITNCSSCHQLDGRGIAGAFPPLAHNPTVTGDPAQVIRIVQHGQRGTIRANGNVYRGEMPAWDGLLSNTDIAAVVSYIRSAWGNRAAPVSESDVR
jgi:mono/diheme cytochrome c family protein